VRRALGAWAAGLSVFHDSVISALRSLCEYRLRAALTAFGIIIGVTSVMVVTNVGNGLQRGYQDYVAEAATEIVVAKAVPTGRNSARELRDADADALDDRARAPSISDVTPVITGPRIVYKDQRVYRGLVAGSLPNYLFLAHRELTAGAFFTVADQDNGARKVVLGSKIVDMLFAGDGASAVGTTVRIGRVRFTVIGTLRANGQDDRALMMPLSAARTYLIGGAGIINKVVVRATSAERVADAVNEINAIMSERHNVRSPELRDFSVVALEELVERANGFYRSLALDCWVIAGLALLVGGVGLANIMLVSVTERTREIGIRRAVGARRAAIMRQFLVEAAVLSGLGGLVGVALGAAATLLAGQIVDSLFTAHPGMYDIRVSAWSILLSGVSSVTVGILSGLCPAVRAGHITPHEALR
jgi:putative ABC transport system permease protein